MKKLAFFLVMLAAVAVSQAQTTGTGIVLLTGSPYEFTPTTVDSTTTFEFQLVNTVGVQQIVYFGGLDAPFNVNPLIPTAVPANDTLDMELTFNPSEIGVFSDTLEVLGNVFGNADLVISGQGIQVILDWTPADLSFETTAIGQQSSASVTITSSGDGAGTISNVIFSNPVFSLDEANSSLTIDEGTSGDLTFLFSPTGAGVFNETVDLYTNDPNNSVITIPLSAVGISEVSGEVCDVTWSLADSPFTLVGDVTVPVGCSLTIEPGVVVEMNGYDMQINGSFDCQGSGESPVTALGGDWSFGEGESTNISNLIFQNSEVASFIGEVVYFNDFEESGSDYEFDCSSPSCGTWTGNNVQGNCGCDDFYRQSGSSWSFQGDEGDHFLRFYSVDYYGFIYLASAPTVSLGGFYDISFTFETERFERDCELILELMDDSGNWYSAWTSRQDLESRSDVTYRVVSGRNYSPGEQVNFRIRNNISSTGSSNDQMYTYIDNVSITRRLPITNEVKWDLSGFSSDFQDVAELFNYSAIEVDEGELKIHAIDEDVEFNTSIWAQSPIIVPSSGRYIIEVENRLPVSDYNTYQWVQFKTSSDPTWRYLVENRQRYGSSDGPYTYGWNYDVLYTHAELTAGDRVDFRFRNDIYTTISSEDEIAWYGRNFRMYQVEDAIDFNPVLVSSRDLHLTNCSGGNVQFDADSLQVSDVGSNLAGLLLSGSDSEFSTDGSNIDVVEATGSLLFDGDDSFIGLLQVDGNFDLDINGGAMNGIHLRGAGSANLEHLIVDNASGSGVDIAGDAVILHASYCQFENNSEDGVQVSANSGSVAIQNSIATGNGGSGIVSTIPATLNYITSHGNSGFGVSFASISFSGVVSNSILSQNGFGALNASEFSTEYNYTGNYPQFQEGSYMLEPYSPCVDAAMPWNTDQNMPFGMGGLRADMGAYGGPNNAGWGGSPAPDGAATLQAASDTPQDQGYVVGLTFDASAFDNSLISDNISHYAVWRHYDPTGESIASLDEGNWELLGTMPAQGFTGYAYQAEALGNTNAFGTFNSCYTVVAHTDNEDVYWYSNVMCGEAIDNLAPEDPELNGLVLESGGAQISWTPPTEEDYAYTEIFNDDGFTAEVGNDTLVVDLSALAGNTYTYTAVHYDVNGNASDPVSLTLDISAGLDVINLNAGWNLISIDRSLSDGDVEDLLSGLQPGNLQYVTGFQNGVQFYDPNGLSFLNTLSELDNGYGYWVKVTEDDVLEVGGASLPLNYRPQLTSGWNLIGYPNADDSDPADYFADLIADDNLLYVTGFDQGSQVFDPNGLAFLNTLQELENGFGYWVKTVVGDDPNGMAPANTKSNPAYMVLNGSSQLNDAGGTVDVINALGEVVATMDILEGGYLMTTAVFGADPSDEAATGLQLGEELSFAYNGKLADQTITWEGGMEHRSLALTFSDATEALTLSPNPAQATTQLTFELLSDASVNVQVSDATGRLVMDLPLGTFAEGPQQLTLGLSEFDAGVYEVSVVANGAVLGTTRLLKQQ